MRTVIGPRYWSCGHRGASDGCCSRSLSSRVRIEGRPGRGLGGATSRAHPRRRSDYAGARGHSQRAARPVARGAHGSCATFCTSPSRSRRLLHRSTGGGLVHKDIKPANILVDPTTGTVNPTAFGIPSRLPRERQASSRPESLAGTLAYMAPEIGPDA